MKMRISIALFAIVFLITADTPEEAVKKEKEKLKGTWVVQSFEVNGKPLDALKGMSYVFDGDKLIVKRAKQNDREGSYKLDPSKEPKELDIITPHPDGGKTTTRAVYILDGDELTICSGTTTTTTDSAGKVTEKIGERPKKVDAKSGALITLKREKK
jgi:uncharacterized protein (TIGR03067 family)